MRQESVKVAVSREDGSVAILTFLTLGRGNLLPDGATWEDEAAGYWRREPTEVNLFSEVLRAFSVGPQPTRFRRIEESEVPVDRTFRDALVDTGAALSHDMGKAREIHLAHVRRVRQSRLDQLDRDWMRATGREDKTEAKRVEALRQELRDLPATVGVERAATVEELKALWPAALEA